VKYFIQAALLFSLLFISYIVPAQPFTRQDTLRGSITPERAWWDVLRYDISVTPDYNSKTIKGSCDITFKVLKDGTLMQIDLQQPMQITAAICDGKTVDIQSRDTNVYYINLPLLKNGTTSKLSLQFEGKPREAKNPPWDGGWIFTRDRQRRPWMTVACQGLGASVWYPCKDYQGDEPDNGASLSITVADTLVAVGNGRLKNKTNNNNGTSTWKWEVVSPINNYTIIPYIGKYVNWEEKYPGEKGELDCSYWVMDYNLDTAKKQFGRDVKPMLKCFEDWFGPYPFYEDSYKLVETPHLGMEHQSAVAYGNRYLNGYLGMDLSGTGWGLKWDYIIIHESGHEWFANNITTNDIADMWVHEGFTDYSEVLFTEFLSGKKAGDEYVQGLRKNINNDRPVIGPYGVNKEGSGDMYYKGANLLHTIRQVINDDAIFKAVLRGLNKEFYHQTVTTAQVENYMSKQSGKDLSKIFDQYLRTTKIPVLEYRIKNGQLSYRWNNCVKGFRMPVKVSVNNKIQWITPKETWQTLRIKVTNPANFAPDKNFYINTKEIK
jgi:aminopeptidase N